MTTKKRETTENEGSSMHDTSCIGINYAHRFPKCFRSLRTLLGFSLCTSCHQFNCCHCTKFIHFLTCTGIPCRDSHSENGPVRCCLYTLCQTRAKGVSDFMLTVSIAHVSRTPAWMTILVGKWTMVLKR